MATDRLTFWHRSFIFNSNKPPTWCNNFSVYYPDVCLQLNMFRVFPAHHQELNDCSGSLWFYPRIVVIVVLCGRGRPARPRTQHECHHDTEVKPEAATAVIELLMMGGKTPETRWAVNNHQDNKLKNCCIWLVIYLNSILPYFESYVIVAWRCISLALVKINLVVFDGLLWRSYKHIWMSPQNYKIEALFPVGFKFVMSLDVHGSVHHNINPTEITNNMRPCSRIYYSNVS